MYWAGRSDDSAARADAKGFGIPAEPTEDCCEVWEENWDIVMMFLRLQTQWHNAMGVYTGLNYQSLEWMCDVYEVEDRKAMVDGVRTMEAVALSELAKDS